MNKEYVVDKNYYKTLYLLENDVCLEEINDGYGLYSNIIRVFSNTILELKKDELYLPLVIVLGAKEPNDEMCKMYCKYIEQITKFKNVEVVVEKKDDNYYANFFTNSLPLYVKNSFKKKILLFLNQFKKNHICYGEGKTISLKLQKDGTNFETLGEIHYGTDKLNEELLDNISKKEIISNHKLEKYMNIKKRDEYYEYKDLEDVKNILKIENGLLPSHKLLRTDKFLLLHLNKESGIIKNISDYNKTLADNDLLFKDKDMLETMSKLFYSQSSKHYKTIFNDENKAICFFLSHKLENKPVILVSEKDQWIVYHKDNFDCFNEVICRDKILSYIESKNINTEGIKNLPMKDLANLFIHNGELIVSNDKNMIYLDKEDKNVPLHILMNGGLHHHGYYDNGIWKGLIENMYERKVLPDLVTFSFSPVDNNDHVEVTVHYDGRKQVLSDFFYLPADYYDIMNRQLQKLFTLGIMVKPFDVIKWEKEKVLNIDNIFFPSFIKDVKKNKEKDLFKFLINYST